MRAECLAKGGAREQIRQGRSKETGREESRHRTLGRSLVIVDPMEYQRSPGEPRKPLRTLYFGHQSQGLVTFLVDPPDDLVLITRIQWLGEYRYHDRRALAVTVSSHDRKACTGHKQPYRFGAAPAS